MDKTEFPAYILPDIEMYGGDTVPWEVVLQNEDGSEFTYNKAKDLSCELTITPFKVTTGIGGHAIPISPLLIKAGSIKEGISENAIMVFEFDATDTIALRGKFIYQIEVAYGTYLRVAQGNLYIKQNINR